MGKMMSIWNNFFFRETYSVENLGLVRVWVGFSLIIMNFSQFLSLLTIDITGPGFYFISSIWYFEALGITQTYPPLNFIVFVVLQLATISLMIGYRTRSAIVIIIIAIFYLKGVRDSAAGDDHHRYQMWMTVLLMLLFSKSAHLLSFDKYLCKTKDVLIEKWEANWPIKMMQLGIGLLK